MAKVETATTETKEERKEGPLSIEFVDKDDKTSTRVPENVVGLIVTQRNGELQQRYDFSEFPAHILTGLAASGAKKMMETYARNGADETGSNIIELMNKQFATLKSGKLYTRAGNGESKGARASKFDYEFWQAVAVRFTKAKAGREPTEKELITFRSKLDSYTPKDRLAFLRKQEENPIFKLAVADEKRARLAKVAKASKGAEEFEVDLF